MAAGIHNITIEQGATFRLIIQWLGSDSLPVDLTGYTARMQVRPFAESDDILLTVDSESTGGITFESDAQILIEVDAAVTAALTDYFGSYDLELESASGVVTRLIQGSVTISPEVTRS